MNLHLQFEPRDLWIGVYWEKRDRLIMIDGRERIITFYVCLIPCFPIVIEISHSIHRSSRPLKSL